MLPQAQPSCTYGVRRGLLATSQDHSIGGTPLRLPAHRSDASNLMSMNATADFSNAEPESAAGRRFQRTSWLICPSYPSELATSRVRPPHEVLGFVTVLGRFVVRSDVRVSPCLGAGRPVTVGAQAPRCWSGSSSLPRSYGFCQHPITKYKLAESGGPLNGVHDVEPTSDTFDEAGTAESG
jgi:hypothetical protein